MRPSSTAAKTDADTARKLKLLRLSLTLATPADPDGSGGGDPDRGGDGGHVRKGQVLPAGREVPRPRGHHEDHGDLARREGAARRLDRLARDRPSRCKKDYVRYVELANKGARELGFADAGAMWRSKYDMPPDAFAKELDRLWEQVQPLYVSLHAYVRAKLREKYGDARARERPDPRAPARQHVGADLGQRLSARRADGRRPGLRPDADPQEPQDRRGRHGAVRRGVLHLARLRPAAEDVLGAVAAS